MYPLCCVGDNSNVQIKRTFFREIFLSHLFIFLNIVVVDSFSILIQAAKEA